MAKYKWMTKRGILTNDNFLKMTNLAKFITFWQKCKQDDKGGMSIIVGFTKMTFCEIGEFGKGFITCKGLAKNLNGTTKKAY